MLVVAAHPDDEAVGCGGALRRHALDGDEVRAVFLTSGEAGGHGIEHPGETREREAREAATVLGIRDLQFWREPDGRLRARRELVERLADLIESWCPSLVYVPHERDDHPDHCSAAAIVRLAVAAAGRPVEVRLFEILVATGSNRLCDRHLKRARGEAARHSRIREPV